MPDSLAGGPVDLLLITWNRREYAEKTLASLLASRSDFRLYCWDNASADGTADLIRSLDDPRVVRKHFAAENAKQRTPSLWFLEEARGDVVGKVDDDLLLPEGWIERIAPLVRAEERFGMLSCWVYMPEDWDEQLASHKVIEAGGARIFRNMWVGGASFLARRNHLRRYICEPEATYGFPIDQTRMTLDGLINGYPLPLLMAHHMDDPRSPHCLMNREGVIGEFASITARKRGFQTPEAYGRWIAADARAALLEPVASQVRRMRLLRDRSLLGRVRRRLSGLSDRIRRSGHPTA